MLPSNTGPKVPKGLEGSCGCHHGNRRSPTCFPPKVELGLNFGSEFIVGSFLFLLLREEFSMSSGVLTQPVFKVGQGNSE